MIFCATWRDVPCTKAITGTWQNHYQEQNKQKALEILQSKLFKLEEEKRKAEIEGRQISKTTEIEWGNQIRSYVLHPYKMVKDHRTDVETSDVEGVLEKGNLDSFIEAENILLK